MKLYFSSILCPLTIYGIKISTIQKQEGKHVNQTNYYKIEIIHNVDELLEYRIKKGFKFEDNDGISIKPSTVDGYKVKHTNMIDLSRTEHTCEYNESHEDSE